ncbi:MAG TPA: DUF6496 domain-containing protein [Myxococcales bacterium]|jgi:hypothetical protein|nr:DUF6496 domain-containing protein [Myxococcales bacterium]
MPDKETLERVQSDKRQGKSPSTQAGEFVRQEIHHVRQGKHGARSTKQAIAIGLSEARRAGVKLPPPKRGARSSTRKQARRDVAKGRRGGQRTSPRRSSAVRKALKREGRSAASRPALSRQARAAARRRSATSRRNAARKGAATKGPARRSAAARKAARSRKSRS